MHRQLRWLRIMSTPAAFPCSLTASRVPAGEMQWMHPEMEHSLVWDASIGPEGQRLDSLTLLLRRAIAAPLLPAQSHEVFPISQAALHCMQSSA